MTLINRGFFFTQVRRKMFSNDLSALHPTGADRQATDPSKSLAFPGRFRDIYLRDPNRSDTTGPLAGSA